MASKECPCFHRLLGVHSLLLGIGNEQAVANYIDWWAQQVRSRPQKLGQLRVCWEATSWRIAIALRTKIPFEDAAADLMKDTQALQETMARELQTDKTAKKLTKNNNEKAFAKTFEMNDKGKGEAKGNGKGKGCRPDDCRWQPYNTQGNWQGSWGSPWKQHGFGGYNQYSAFYQQQQQFQKE